MDHSVWTAALQHAGLSTTDPPVQLIELDGLGPHRGQGGFFINAGKAAVFDLDDPLAPHRAVINACIKRHRVGLWNGYPEIVQGALIRHELEHVRQFNRFGAGVFALHEAVKFGLFELTTAGIDGAFVLVNASPLELDCNAAAARFSMQHFARSAVETTANTSDPNHQVLFRYEGPQPDPNTLPERIVRFGWLFREACEQVAAKSGLSFTEVLEGRFPGSSAWWT